MVEAGLRPKTVQDAKLAPVRAIPQWGVNNKHLMANPADGISFGGKTKQDEKKRSRTQRQKSFSKRRWTEKIMFGVGGLGLVLILAPGYRSSVSCERKT